MTLVLNIFHLTKNHMKLVEDVPKELCIIDTILEEKANQQGMQDMLTEEFAECAEQHQEADMESV